MRWLALVCTTVLGCGRSGFDPVRLDGTSASDTSGDDASGDGPALRNEAALANRNATSPPSVRRSSGAAVEPGTPERIWIFGGYNGTFLGDLHAYSTASNSWTSITGTGPPGPRERHALAWDPNDNVLVLFGGQYRMTITFTHYDALYAFDPAASAWTLIPTSGSWPSPRKDATLVWVPHLGNFLLYGGNDGANQNNRFDDLWLLALDAAGASATWTKLSPGGVTAPARSSACVAYDPAGRRLIVYGGETQDGVDVSTTYQYLLDTNVWQLDATSGTPPAGESFSQCAWDPTTGRLVLYGGQADGGAPLPGAHAYDPDAMQWIAPLVQSATPGARSDGGAVFSPALGSMVWFGGRPGTTTYTNETWTYDLQ